MSTARPVAQGVITAASLALGSYGASGAFPRFPLQHSLMLGVHRGSFDIGR